MLTATATNSKIMASLDDDSPDVSDGFHSRYIKATLTGRISKMCVYWSSRRASAKEEVRGFHQITKEIAHKTEKRKSGETLEMDSRAELVSTFECYATGWRVR
jgi:hypothetical protein